jgi:hypothetical protein
MSADGSKVFFETTDALVPQDTNGTDDVYEWEASGAGGCATPRGCVALISSGQSPYSSHFQNATSSGNDVFFLTREQLVAQDTDQNVDLYDAHIDGGFPASPTPSPCSRDTCRGQPTPGPSVPIAASVSFVGAGNVPSSSGSVGAATIAKVRVLRKVVHGTTFFLRVQVPVKGVVMIRGKLIRPFRRRVGKAGTYMFRLRLTANAKRQLKHKHKLKLKLSVGYQPAGAGTSTATVNVTVLAKGAKSR